MSLLSRALHPVVSTAAFGVGLVQALLVDALARNFWELSYQREN